MWNKSDENLNKLEQFLNQLYQTCLELWQICWFSNRSFKQMCTLNFIINCSNVYRTLLNFFRMLWSFQSKLQKNHLKSLRLHWSLWNFVLLESMLQQNELKFNKKIFLKSFVFELFSPKIEKLFQFTSINLQFLFQAAINRVIKSTLKCVKFSISKTFPFIINTHLVQTLQWWAFDVSGSRAGNVIKGVIRRIFFCFLIRKVSI